MVCTSTIRYRQVVPQYRALLGGAVVVGNLRHGKVQHRACQIADTSILLLSVRRGRTPLRYNVSKITCS